MDNYVKLKKLGSGSFGHIYLVKHIQDDQLYVLKSIDMKSLTKQQRRDAVKEVQIQSQFNNPYIVQYKEYFYSNKSIDSLPALQHRSQYDNLSNNMIQQHKQRSITSNSLDNIDLQHGTILYIIMEYADNGDLDQKIKSNKSKSLYDESTILRIITQICIALQQIHLKHIIHRDIKCENIFMMKNGDVKLGDFGISKTLQNTLAQAHTRIGGWLDIYC